MKKTILITAIALCSYALSNAQSGNVTIHINGIEEVNGAIFFSLFKSDDGFPKEKDKAYKSGKISEYKTKASYTFENIPYGTYAITFFQDENENGMLDTNFIGFPKEPVGASNMTSMGKPSFNKCKFDLDESSKEMTLEFIL